MITNDGEEVIFEHLAGERASWAGMMKLGIGTQEPTKEDTGLEFEVASAEIDLIVSDIARDVVIVRAVVGPEVFGIFSEIGLYAVPSFDANRIITSFSPAEEGIVGGNTYDYSRLGSSGIRVIDSEPIIYEASFNFQDMLPTDTFAMAATNLSGQSATATVRLVTSTGTYFSAAYEFVPGYSIMRLPKDEFLPVGTPEWNGIVSLDFTFEGLELDIVPEALRADVKNNMEQQSLVARSVFETPVHKGKTQHMDVEYLVPVSFG